MLRYVGFGIGWALCLAGLAAGIYMWGLMLLYLWPALLAVGAASGVFFWMAGVVEQRSALRKRVRDLEDTLRVAEIAINATRTGRT